MANDIPVDLLPDDSPEANSHRFEACLDSWLRCPRKPRLVISGSAIYNIARPIKLSAKHRNLVLDMSGATLRNVVGGPWWFDTATMIVDGDNFGYLDRINYAVGSRQIIIGSPNAAENYPVGSLAILFQESWFEGGRSPAQMLVQVIAKQGSVLTINHDTIEGLTAAKWVRNGRRILEGASAGSNRIVLETGYENGGIKPGNYLWVGDGVGVNEVYGEFVVVESIRSFVSDGRLDVNLQTGLERDYIADRAFVCPGPFASNISVVNGTFGGVTSLGEQEIATFRFAPGLRLRNVSSEFEGDHSRPARVGMVASANILVQDCRFAREIQVNSCHGVGVLNSSLMATHEEWSRLVHYQNCELIGAWRSDPTCRQIDATNCRFRKTRDFIAVQDARIVGCRQDGGTLQEPMFSGAGIVLRDFTSDALIRFYESCQNCVLDNVQAGGIVLNAGSSGVLYAPIRGQLVQYDPESWALVGSASRG